MRFRGSRVLIILAAAILGAGAVMLVLSSTTSTTTSGLLVNSPNAVIASHFALHIEQIGGCPEARLDGGRDVDPSGIRDVEDDECIPGQHRARQPDGAPLDAKGS